MVGGKALGERVFPVSLIWASTWVTLRTAVFILQINVVLLGGACTTEG